MSTLTVVITAELDGKPLPGFPFCRDVTCEQSQLIDIDKAADGTGVFVQLPTLNQIAEVRAFLLLNPGAQIRYRIGSQSDGHLIITQGGIFLALGCDISSGTTNIQVSNNDAGGAAVAIQGFVGGD